MECITDENEKTEVPMERARMDLRKRTNEDLLFDVTIEYCNLSENLKKLNSAIEADPKSVRQEHKDLWKKQAEYMEGYKKILAERIKDILEHN